MAVLQTLLRSTESRPGSCAARVPAKVADTASPWETSPVSSVRLRESKKGQGSLQNGSFTETQPELI